MNSQPDEPKTNPPLDSAPPRAALRRLVQALLKSDEDLEAFCLDYFELVHDRFGRSMDRLAKLNLLLELADPTAILINLQELFQHDQSALATIGHLLADPQTDEARRTRVHWEDLELLYLRREELRHLSQSTESVDKEIVALKRTQRTNSQVAEGEVLQGRYRLIETIGRGGFAKVWKAFDRETQRVVAVKILHIEQSEEPRRVERFNRGARQMQGLNHPNIVRVLDGPGEHKDFHYFVMDYVVGGDLFRGVLAQKLDRAAALLAVLQVGAALEYAHQRGLIHRDVKPQNILLDGQGIAHLTDFDLVWAADTTGGTRTGGMGTFLYSAPEEMEDASRVDRRADVYSLGMTTLFVLHGKNLTRRVLDSRALFIHGLDCPEATKSLLQRATAPDPEDRPTTVAEFCSDLAGTLHMDPECNELNASALSSGMSVERTDPNIKLPLRGDRPRTAAISIIAVIASIGLGLGIKFSIKLGKGLVVVTVMPPRAATISIDGTQRGIVEPNRSFMIRDIKRGSHLMLVRSGDIETQHPFELKSNVLQLKIQLSANNSRGVNDRDGTAGQPLGVLRLRLPPGGALVAINGRLINESELQNGYLVPAGVPQEVTVKKAGKRPVTYVEILKAGEEKERTIELQDGRGHLVISTRPAGADIEVNGRSYGRSPVIIEDLDPTRTAKVAATMPGVGSLIKLVSFGESFDQRLDLDLSTAENGDNSIRHGNRSGESSMRKLSTTLAPSHEKNGYLVANTQPYAKVLVDGKDTGKMTPIVPREHIPLKPGKHVITFVTRDTRINADVNIKSGEEAKVVRDLTEGYLIANSQPYAKVLVDGKDTGKVTPIAPRDHISLKPGKHLITFVTSDTRYSEVVNISAGEEAKVVRNLTE